MKSLLSLALILGLGTPADALSCQRWNAADAYMYAADSDKRYAVVSGVLNFGPGPLPKPDLAQQSDSPPVTEVPARMSGLALDRKGFNQSYTASVTLKVLCIGPWCGGVSPGQKVIAFVEQTDAGGQIEISPCPRFVFTNPKPGHFDQILNCHRGSKCIGAGS